MLHGKISRYFTLLRLKQNEIALINYVRENSCKDEVKEVIRSLSFWNEIDQLLRILKPIHDHIEASEAVSAHAGDHLQRWFDTSRHLNTFRQGSTFGCDIASYLNLKFQDRMHRQVQDTQWAAYFLNPTTIHEQIPAPLQRKIFEVIQRYCKMPQEAIVQFAQYRAAAGEFFQSYSWNYKDEPKYFWLIQVSWQLLVLPPF